MGTSNKRPNEVPVSRQVAKSDPPVLLVTGGSSGPVIIPPIPIQDAPITPIAISVRVSLQLPGQVQTDTVNKPLPPVFYVIVGRGPAATIDHTTLLQSDWGKERINDSPAGKLPILHIGFSNPWSGFFSHGMGQPTYLLGLPGFHAENQPNIVGKDAIKDGGLTSTVFGSCVDNELAWCIGQEEERWRDALPRTVAFKKCGWPVLNGWVGWFQSKGGLEPLFKPGDIGTETTGGPIQQAMTDKLATEPYPEFPYGVAPYRLLVLRDVDGTMTPEFIYAQYIDFCTGSGRPRQDRKEAVYKTARLEPWRDPATWNSTLKKRKILVAGEAIRRECEWENGKRVCVANGGAIGLNAAERARDEACWTDWFHNTDLMEAFNNPRNFTFLRHKTLYQERESGEGGKISEPELIAAGSKVRMGRSAEPASTVENPGGLVVSLRKGVPRDPATVLKAPLVRDYRGNESDLDLDNARWTASEWYAGEYLSGTTKTLPSTDYDRLIFHGGLQLDQLGQPDHSGCNGNVFPFEGNDRMVGMETRDRLVRVLGAAIAGYPGLPAFNAKKPGSAPSDKLALFRATLPVSAVPDGFIISGLNIAEANHFFTYSNKNTNVNTMTLEELETALWHGGVSITDARELAARIVEARPAANGYSDFADLEKKVIAAAAKKLDLLKKRTVEDIVNEGYEKYLANKKDVEELKKTLKDPTNQKELDETLKLMYDTEVLRRTNLIMGGQRDLDKTKKEEAEKTDALPKQLADNKSAIEAAVKFSY